MTSLRGLRPRKPHLRLQPSLEALEDRTLLDAGALDPSFGTGGRVVTDFIGPLDNPALTALQQPDGKLLVLGGISNGTTGTGTTSDLALVRYNADGSLDDSFGANGRATTGFPFLSDPQASVSSFTPGLTLLPDGKIMVASVRRTIQGLAPNLAVARFNVNGTLDTAFGTGGRIVRAIGRDPVIPLGVAFQLDGKIVVAIQSAINSPGPTVARFNADGSPDTGFGTGGSVTTSLGGTVFLGASSLLVQPDGKLLLAGTAAIGAPTGHILLRYNPDANLDPGFGDGGKVFANVGPGVDFRTLGATLQADGKIVLAGAISDDFAVVRYHANGSLDGGFGTGGKVTTDFGASDRARGVTVQEDGKIVAAGFTGPTSAHDFALARYNTNGSLDGGFGTDGKVTTDFGTAGDEANGVLLQSDGQVVAVGAAAPRGADFALARYTDDGTLDVDFGAGGKVTTDIVGPLDNQARGMAAYPDGRVVVVGGAANGPASDFAVARYLPTGVLDGTFGTGGRVTTTFDVLSTAHGVAVQADGKIVVVGSGGTGFGVARYNLDGSPDASFGNGGKVTVVFPGAPGFGGGGGATAYRVLVQPDGKLVVAGGCGITFVLARLAPNGNLDAGFGANGLVGSCGFGPRYTVSRVDLTFQGDGKVVAGITYSGVGPGAELTRFNPDGTPDPSFNAGRRVLVGLPILGGLSLQPDGKIVVAGTVPTVVSQTIPLSSFAVARFNADGSADTGFGAGGRTSVDLGGQDSPAGLFVQSDGKILVVGTSTDLASPGRAVLVLTRFLPNGTLNSSFGTAGRVTAAGGPPFISASQALLLPDGKVMVAGTASGTETGNDFLVARFTTEDTLTTANQWYVGQLYLNLLGRSAEPGGLAAFVGLLDRGQATRVQVAQIITGSEEYRTVVVRNLYRTLLGREADLGGLDFFVGFLRSGGTVAQLKAVLLGSAEYFQNRGGGTNDGLVTALYRDVLGRDADAGGRQFFNQVLTAGAPRIAVTGLIVASRESLERIVQGWYRQYLRRSADAGGLSGFAGFLTAGGREEALVTLFLSSPEFTAGL